MKKLFILFVSAVLTQSAMAQVWEPARERTNEELEEEVQVKGFDKSKLFTGGSLDLSFFNRTTLLGATPHFGYSINRFADVAVLLGYKYISQRDLYTNNKTRINTITPGAFVRVFPVQFLFAQAQWEKNFITMKEIAPGFPTNKYNDDGTSLLVGGGFANGRSRYNNTYYYMTIMWDISKSSGYSPYKDQMGRAVPIIKAGFNIGLFQGTFSNRR